MCKGRTVNSLWVQDGQFLRSIDPVNGNLIVYPLLSSDSLANGITYKIEKVVCISDSNYVLTVALKSAQDQDQKWVILVYSIDT